MNSYAILKEHLPVLHKLQPKYSQIAIKTLSVMKFELVEIDTFFPISFFVCTELEIFSNQKESGKSTSEKHILYFKLSNKPNIDVDGITFYM